jgi:hypothetical protein
MPPIDDQGQSPWCQTFAVKGVLDYEIHEACLNGGGTSCDYGAANRVSAEDLNALRADAPPSERGNAYELVNSDSTLKILLGAQKGIQNGDKTVGPAMEQDLPMNQSVFYSSASQTALIMRLTDYYESQAHSSADCPNCETTAETRDSLTQIPDLLNAARQSADLSTFADRVTPQREIPQSVKDVRKPFPAPFNVSWLRTINQAALMSALVDTLKTQRQPLLTDVCILQLDSALGIHGDGVQASPSDSCGAHAMTIVGFRKLGTQCEVHLRNTWGATWPEDRNGDGSVWADEASFLSSLNKNQGDYSLYHVESRTATAPVRNKYSSNGEEEEGIFDSRFRLIDGEQKNVKMSDDSRYTGTLKNGLLVCGTLTKTDGTVSCVANNLVYKDLGCCH